jgi:hypothetical protein
MNAKCKEKICFKARIECGADKGNFCVIVHVLYGLKSASALADPDVWI